MALTTADVARLADLARIELSAEELERFAPELDIVLAAVASVSEVAGSDVTPMSHALALTNVFRDDVVRPSLTPAQALAMAPAVEDDRFRAPRILTEEG
ncbi:MAG: Asp-tRNA(Asn)/Glu-tRNA(Gln) amidotransferase subunit GatC [Nigerium sp.]|nr:Asp-tRNA(Asn)/Glu-tRNA(Gln) amidotransferase subunit GatC [Nigerium sp.]